MHVLATNVCLWLRTLTKESLHEIYESEVEGHSKSADSDLAKLHRHNCSAAFDEKVVEYFDSLNAEVTSSPILFPFVIELTLIGANVALNMFRHVAVEGTSPTPFPRPRLYLIKLDCSDSLPGFMFGTLALIFAILNIIVFGFTAERSLQEAEFYSKVLNITMNGVGVIALLVGIIQVKKLPLSHVGDKDVDSALLRVGAFFALLYLNFSVVAGIFGQNNVVELHVLINGVVEIIQVVVQLIFLNDLRWRFSDATNPGRNVVAFLVLFNLGQWAVLTFEVQKIKATLSEAAVFGFLSWVAIQRATLPIAIFFRFHSAVSHMELWKRVYAVNR